VEVRRAEVPSAVDPEAARLLRLVELLLTVANVDGTIHPLEHAFINQYVESVLRHGEQQGLPDRRRGLLEQRYQLIAGELVEAPLHVLPDRALALFREMDPHDQSTAIELVHGLVHADGVLTPPEIHVQQLLLDCYCNRAPSVVAAPRPVPPPMLIQPAAWKDLAALSHPLLDPIEQTYSPHPIERAAQVEWDYKLVQAAIAAWNRMRAVGNGRLTALTNITQLPVGSQFLDGFVQVMRPAKPVELVVVGDTHGCYSCLKAALLQSNFIERVWAHQWNPNEYPDIKLVLLGDYIDRGLFSFDGVLRAALHLFVAMPDNVVLLRGNHEWLRWFGNTISSGVSPAEGLASIAPHVPVQMLEAYRVLFENMPTSFMCERTLFVHAGIPRDDTMERFQDLSSLNDPEIRFQMMWSDPVLGEHIPVAEQRLDPRFRFGSAQFRAFMERTGFHTLVRGHEQINSGFEVTYNLGDLMLFNVFSAGGWDNRDLPPDSSYRAVTPMAVTIEVGGETPIATPWPLHYRPFNFEPHNGLYRAQPVLEFRYT